MGRLGCAVGSQQLLVLTQGGKRAALILTHVLQCPPGTDGSLGSGDLSLSPKHMLPAATVVSALCRRLQ